MMPERETPCLEWQPPGLPMRSPVSSLFLSCDWGTSAFRLRLVDARTLRVIASSNDNRGILTTYRRWNSSRQPVRNRLRFYARIIREHVVRLQRKHRASLAGIPVVVSGMASSTVGIGELPYRKLPIAVSSARLVTKRIGVSKDFPHPLLMISGVCTDSDIMRGEETMLVGALAGVGKRVRDCVAILPGTHSKHAWIRGGEITKFSTYMTGEFFALLSQHSILSQSLATERALSGAKARAAFVRGVRDGARGNSLRDCFSIRASNVLRGASKASNFHRLSGLLIGAELGKLRSRTILLISSPEFRTLYETALRVLRPHTRIVTMDAGESLLRGQKLIATRFGMLPADD